MKKLMKNLGSIFFFYVLPGLLLFFWVTKASEKKYSKSPVKVKYQYDVCEYVRHRGNGLNRLKILNTFVKIKDKKILKEILMKEYYTKGGETILYFYDYKPFINQTIYKVNRNFKVVNMLWDDTIFDGRNFYAWAMRSPTGLVKIFSRSDIKDKDCFPKKKKRYSL